MVEHQELLHFEVTTQGITGRRTEAEPPLLLPINRQSAELFAPRLLRNDESAFETPLEPITKSSLAHARIIIGSAEDPCHPFTAKFERTLRLLEQLASTQVHSVVVNTRSPLVLLALPVLKALGERVTVNMALETQDDGLARRYLPHWPRPSERISTIRALQNFRIPVTIQAAPLLLQNQDQKGAFEFALQLSRLNCPLKIFSLQELLILQKKESTEVEVVHLEGKRALSRTAFRGVARVLSELAPELILSRSDGIDGAELAAA